MQGRKVIVMRKDNKANAVGAKPDKVETPKFRPARRQAERFQTSGFSREEMRQIVVEMIG